MCTPQLDHSVVVQFTELYREEKKEEGDRGARRIKGGNEKEGDRSSQ